MIKPDFSDDEKMAEVSFMARLVYILLWPQSDDYGVVKGNPRWLKPRLFPYDDSLTVAQFTEWLAELEKLKRLIKFVHNGEPYYFMPKFLVHQRIEKPSKARNPEPPESVLRQVADELPTSRVVVGDQSENTPQPVGDEVEEEKEIEIEPEGKLSSNNGSTTGDGGDSAEQGTFSRETRETLSLARKETNKPVKLDPDLRRDDRVLKGDDVVEQPIRVLEISKFVTKKYPNSTIRQREGLAGRIERLARSRNHDLLPEEAAKFAELVLAEAPTFWQAQAFVTVLEKPCEDEQVYQAVKAARNGHAVSNGRGP